MARFLKWLILLPVAAVILALAVANRHMATIYLDPFPNGGPNGPQVSAPFYLLMLGTLMVGVLIGGVATWMGQGRSRRAARQARAELRRTRAELVQLEPQTPSLVPALERRK
ncbi:lipopolysaccharide assembly protein LapA domain-containing protein [Methylocella sp.]|uniref:lipopolysaccharide assembly protein LapA domain-containing protein n=1 Tax=Methylocella sp. TaxID=1978226 RepID=UPI003784FC58